jgi:hypothetical protein
LLIGIVRKGIGYCQNKAQPITREEIVELNSLLAKMGFRIPELWDREFLASLPLSQPEAISEVAKNVSQSTRDRLKAAVVSLTSLSPQQRGFGFERFLNQFFQEYDLMPRPGFRIVGEQIDGSVVVGSEVYLVEAKWHDEPIGQSELLAFSGKVAGKAEWSRGLFFSYSGFSADGLVAFARGKRTNIVGFDCYDFLCVLENDLILSEVIGRKVRRAAETNEMFVSVRELFLLAG